MAGSKSYPKGSTPFRNADPIVLARALAADSINVRGTGRMEDARRAAAEEGDRTPNWNIWRHVPELELWGCVALSLNIDPRKVHVHRIGGTVEYPAFNESQEFDDRIYIASENLHGALRCTRVFADSRVKSRVSMRQFAAWVREIIRWPAPPELLAMADEQKTPMPASPAASHDAPATAATSKHPANPFRSMPGLRWAEITITFNGEEAVRVKARSKSETYTYDGMELRDRRARIAKPKKCWETFRFLAIVSRSTSGKTWRDVLFDRDIHNLKKRISVLRDELKGFFRINDDPIVYKGGDEYEAAFILTTEETVFQDARARHIGHTREPNTDHADEDEDEDIEEEMQKPPGEGR